MNAVDRAGLRKPFPPELIGKLPGTAKRPAMDYVGHAAVTDRLLQFAGDWHFEVIDRFGTENECWVLGRLTIDGVNRDDYGEGDDPKKAISDALKRCAMRFGVALDLWSKEDLKPEVLITGKDDNTSTDGGAGVAPERQPVVEVVHPLAPPSSNGQLTIGLLTELAEAYGTQAKALRQARLVYHDAPPSAIEELSEAQARELIAIVKPHDGV